MPVWVVILISRKDNDVGRKICANGSRFPPQRLTCDQPLCCHGHGEKRTSKLLEADVEKPN